MHSFLYESYSAWHAFIFEHAFIFSTWRKQIEHGLVENSETPETSKISEIFFRLFLFRLFDFGLILKIENSEEENSENKFRRFRNFWVFDLPLFDLSLSSDRLSFFTLYVFFVFFSYFVWIFYFRLLNCNYPTCKYLCSKRHE